MLEKALNQNAMQCVASEKLGKVRRIDDAAGRYIEFCKGTFPNHLSLARLKIVVDSAHGLHTISRRMFTVNLVLK